MARLPAKLAVVARPGEASTSVDRDRGAPIEGRFEDAVRAHEPELTILAERLGSGKADARDLVQDTFERALRAWDRLPAGSNVRGWLITILHNLFIDRCRRARRAPTSPIPDQLQAPVPEEVAVPAWASVTPDQLRASLSELDDEFRRAYELHALEGRSYKQIADELDIPVSTVGTRLLRARRKLRLILLRSMRAEETK